MPCPQRRHLRGSRPPAGTSVPGGDTQVTRINEVTFTSYHRFGSTSRILPASPTPGTLP